MTLLTKIDPFYLVVIFTKSIINAVATTESRGNRKGILFF